jgi:hypothetical protein
MGGTCNRPTMRNAGSDRKVSREGTISEKYVKRPVGKRKTLKLMSY